jgi:hypothetical protein
MCPQFFGDIIHSPSPYKPIYSFSSSSSSEHQYIPSAIPHSTNLTLPPPSYRTHLTFLELPHLFSYIYILRVSRSSTFLPSVSDHIRSSFSLPPARVFLSQALPLNHRINSTLNTLTSVGHLQTDWSDCSAEGMTPIRLHFPIGVLLTKIFSWR